jgi:uncharacterized protein YdeI (YjbR/CyaY-like superfamily)
MKSQVDAYFAEAPTWRKELQRLRKIILELPLTEELKWGKPCYAFRGGNVVLLLPLKKYCALLLCKGALLKDPHGILIKPGENTQAARQIRFTHLREIVAKETILKGYLQQAVQVEKAGLDVVYKKAEDFAVPAEFQKRLDESPALKTAFKALTPGRQRAYLICFSAPKQARTREARIEKYRKQILEGRGLYDGYKR